MNIFYHFLYKFSCKISYKSTFIVLKGYGHLKNVTGTFFFAFVYAWDLYVLSGFWLY